VTKLETIALNQFCKVCAITCTLLEDQDDDELRKKNEAKFASFLRMLPRPVMEQVIPQTLKIITQWAAKFVYHY
jgi:hypothetical protein